MQKGGIEKFYIGLKMALLSRTGGGQIRTGPTRKLPEIVRRTGVYFRPWQLLSLHFILTVTKI